jgi:putative endonuclease
MYTSLKSKTHDRYYIGYTENIESRLHKHNSGSTPSTKPYRPWEMPYFEEFQNKSEAMKREKEMKKKKSKSYIEYLISSKECCSE